MGKEWFVNCSNFQKIVTDIKGRIERSIILTCTYPHGMHWNCSDLQSVAISRWNCSTRTFKVSTFCSLIACESNSQVGLWTGSSMLIPNTRRTMAAALGENTKKQSIVLVLFNIAITMEQLWHCYLQMLRTSECHRDLFIVYHLVSFLVSPLLLAHPNLAHKS